MSGMSKGVLWPIDKCPACKTTILTSDYDSADFLALNDEEKAIAISQLFGGEMTAVDAAVDEEIISSSPTMAFDMNAPAAGRRDSDEAASGIGSALKIVAIIIIVLTAIGSIAMMGELGFAAGLALLLVCLLIGLIAFGIGEMCTVLKRIDSRLKEIEKK